MAAWKLSNKAQTQQSCHQGQTEGSPFRSLGRVRARDAVLSSAVRNAFDKFYCGLSQLPSRYPIRPRWASTKVEVLSTA